MQCIDAPLYYGECIFEIKIILAFGPGDDFIQETDRGVLEIKYDFVHTSTDVVLLLRMDSDQFQEFRAWLMIEVWFQDAEYIVVWWVIGETDGSYEIDLLTVFIPDHFPCFLLE